MSKKILVLNGNPKQRSFSDQLARAYVASAELNNEVRFHRLADMDFDPSLNLGYDKSDQLQDTLESDLQIFQESIQWADHLVIFTPVWWGGLPAKLKGIFDRTFLPGFAYKFHEGKTLPEKLLKGKTARIAMTLDTPAWYYRLFQGAPALSQLKNTTLEFCGYGPVKHNMIGPIIKSDESKRKQWIEEIRKLGLKGI